MTNYTLTIPARPILSLGYALAPGTAASRYQRSVRYVLWFRGLRYTRGIYQGLHLGQYREWTDRSFPSAVSPDSFGDDPFDEADYEDIYAHTHADDCDCDGCHEAAQMAADAHTSRIESLACDR